MGKAISGLPPPRLGNRQGARDPNMMRQTPNMRLRRMDLAFCHAIVPHGLRLRVFGPGRIRVAPGTLYTMPSGSNVEYPEDRCGPGGISNVCERISWDVVFHADAVNPNHYYFFISNRSTMVIRVASASGRICSLNLINNQHHGQPCGVSVSISSAIITMGIGAPSSVSSSSSSSRAHACKLSSVACSIYSVYSFLVFTHVVPDYDAARSIHDAGWFAHASALRI